MCTRTLRKHLLPKKNAVISERDMVRLHNALSNPSPQSPMGAWPVLLGPGTYHLLLAITPSVASKGQPRKRELNFCQMQILFLVAFEKSLNSSFFSYCKRFELKKGSVL